MFLKGLKATVVFLYKYNFKYLSLNKLEDTSIQFCFFINTEKKAIIKVKNIKTK